MKPDKLQKLLIQKDPKAEIRQDTPKSFRIFLFSPKGKRMIITLIEKMKKEFVITKISNYPYISNDYPICVLRVDRLRRKKKVVKRKGSARNSSTNAIISNDD